MNWMTYEPVQNLGLTLLHFIWQGALIGLLYATSLLLTRQARAQVRYDLAVLTLFILAATPIATFFYLSSQPATTGVAAGGNVEMLVFMLDQSVTAAQAGSLLHWVVAAWLVGVAILSTRLLLGWCHLTQLRRSADRHAAEHLRPLLNRIGRQLHIARQVQLAVSSRINSPVVIGWLKPLILLPPAVVAGLPARQLEMVLAHELAHIRRYDHLINLFQTIVETLLFYHPVILWVSRRIRIERENACDDLAVAVTDNRLAYVEMLATLEKLRQPAPRLLLAINDGQILSRIRRLVEQGRTRRQYGMTVPTLVIAILLATVAGISLMPDQSDQHDAVHEPALPVSQLTLPDTLPLFEPSPEPETAEATTMVEHLPSTPLPAERESAASEPVAVVTAAMPDPAPATPERTEPAPIETLDPLEAEVPGPRNNPAQAEVQPVVSNQALPETTEPTEDDRRLPAVPAIEAEPALDRRLAMATIAETINRESLIDNQRRIEPAPARITGGDLIRRIAPDYPVRAMQHRANGVVEVEFLVTAAGEVSEIDVLREQPRRMGFGTAASSAVAQWEFEPFRKGEQPIARKVRVEIEFDLASEVGCRDLLGSRISRC